MVTNYSIDKISVFLRTVSFCDGRVITIRGTDGNDVLRGTPGPDVIHGLGGNDTICGGLGADRITGGFGKRSASRPNTNWEGNAMPV